MRDSFEFYPYRMRLMKSSDADDYYKYGVLDVSEETRHSTGTTAQFTQEQVNGYIHGVVEN